MRLAELAATTEALRGTSSRKAKSDLLADLLRRLAGPEIVPAVGFLLATPRQGAIGVGWATVARLDRAAPGTEAETAPHSGHTADILAFDGLLSELAATTGPGSEAARTELLNRFLTTCSEPEAEFVRRVLVGDARQGALGGVMADAVAKASGIKAATIRRAVMLRGDLGETAAIALLDGQTAVEAIDLEVGRPIQPMLASTSASTDAAIAEIGEASVEWKLDGARIQVHINHDGLPTGSAASDAGDTVRIYTRNLNDVTDRLPQVVEVASNLACRSAVLDGEVLGFFGEDNPQAFQDTMSALGTEPAQSETGHHGLHPHFFDLMYLDGVSLIDRPLRERIERLTHLAPEQVIPQIFTDQPDPAARQLAEALERGHEGVMVKAADSRYEAGRRGKSWRKVKPVHTLDLVVLAAEWGHGRRRGWLSNLHLGARDAETGRFVMVGKTFKGLTDELLRWQTERFQELRIDEAEPSGGVVPYDQAGRQDHTVRLRPELVVEIAVDGAQASTRYPGRVALRFARVRGYRPDRDPGSADTVDAVRKLLPGAIKER
jgi:DNA ligase-1